MEGIAFVRFDNVGLFAKVEEFSKLMVLFVWFDQTKIELFEFGPGISLI